MSKCTMVPGVVYTIHLPKKTQAIPRRRPNLGVFAALTIIFSLVLIVVALAAADTPTTQTAQQPSTNSNTIAVSEVKLKLPAMEKIQAITEEAQTETIEVSAATPVAESPMAEIAQPEVVESVSNDQTPSERNTYALKYWAEHDHGLPEGYQAAGNFKVTFYCACKKCCGKDTSDPAYGITASGAKAAEGITIAVSRKQISLGSNVYIQGLGTFEAQDVGGAIKENRIDVYVSSHEEAIKCGVANLNVWVCQ